MAVKQNGQDESLREDNNSIIDAHVVESPFT